MGNSLNNVQAFDPYRVIGYAMPGYLPASLTNNAVVDAVILKAVSFSTGKEYGITATKKLMEFSSTTITNDATFPHTVNDGNGDVSSLSDVIVYNSKVSSAGGNDPATNRVFYS
mgnify:FL=1